MTAQPASETPGQFPPVASPVRAAGGQLLAASFAALLLELALIRWLPGRIRVIAYFPNLVLIAAFLGLGVSALLRSRSSALLGAGVLAVVGLSLGLGRIAFTSEGTGEHLWLLYYDLPHDAPVVQSWQGLSAQGRFADAYSVIAIDGFESAVSRASVKELALLGDTARFAGKPGDALTAYQALRSRGAGSAQAKQAAFSIARVHFDQRAAYAEAA